MRRLSEKFLTILFCALDSIWLKISSKEIKSDQYRGFFLWFLNLTLNREILPGIVYRDIISRNTQEKSLKVIWLIQCLLFANLTGKIYEQENTIADVGNWEHTGSYLARIKYRYIFKVKKGYTQKQPSRALIKITISIFRRNHSLLLKI